ncbi:MAG TPA: OmpA family protein [Desulfuromonadaceae bacterium]|nr:OmpA family protein [Desulfuromonadaceae bacterium]
MKITKLIYPLALVLACGIAVTGCGGHKVVKPTPLPGRAALPPPDVPPTPGFNPGENPQPTPDSFFTGPDGKPMKMDRARLAGNTIHFTYDSAAIKRTEHSNIEAVAQALSSDPSAKLLIEGNCDERGTEEYNRALGERRAGAARKELIKMGISANRIMTKSFGKDKPATDGHDEAARAQNRRDDFVILLPTSSAGGNQGGS